MRDNDTATLIQLLLETGAFVAILGIGLARLRDGAWAVLAFVGGLLAAVTVTVTLLLFVESTYTSSSTLFDFFVRHIDWLSPALQWARAVGIALVAAAFVVRIRQPRINPLNG